MRSEDPSIQDLCHPKGRKFGATVCKCLLSCGVPKHYDMDKEGSLLRLYSASMMCIPGPSLYAPG